MIELLYLLGFILLIYVIVRSYLGVSSTHWPTVDGVVEKSEIIERKNRNSSANRIFYHPLIEYCYEVNSRKYSSSSVDSRLSGSTNKNYIENLVSNFKAGDKAIVYYNPYIHSISFLRAGLYQKAAYTTLAFIGLGFTVAGIGYLVTGQKHWLVYKIFELINYII
jgi:hypothetical protein